MRGGAIISHRGEESPTAPENSLAAFAVAIERNMPIELDVVLTSDGVPIVFHDAKLDRLTNRTGWVAKQTFEQIQQARLSNGEPIHTLGQIMDIVDGRVPIIIDIKPQLGVAGADMARAVSREIQHRPYYRGLLATQSFSPTYLRKMRDLAPDVPRGQLSYFIEDLALLPFSKPDFLATDFRSMRIWLGLRRGLGLPLLGWGITEQNLASGQNVFDSVIADVENHQGRDLPSLKSAFGQVRDMLSLATMGEVSVIEALEHARNALMQSDAFQEAVAKIDRVLGQEGMSPAERTLVELCGELSKDLAALEAQISLADDRWYRAGQKVGRTLLNVASFLSPSSPPQDPEDVSRPLGARP